MGISWRRRCMLNDIKSIIVVKCCMLTPLTTLCLLLPENKCAGNIIIHSSSCADYAFKRASPHYLCFRKADVHGNIRMNANWCVSIPWRYPPTETSYDDSDWRRQYNPLYCCFAPTGSRPRRKPFCHLLSLNDCRLHKFWLMIFWTINHDYINIVVYVTEFVDIFMLLVFLSYTISLLFFISFFLWDEYTSCNRKDISFYCQGVLSVAAVLQSRVPLSCHIYFMMICIHHSLRMYCVSRKQDIVLWSISNYKMTIINKIP